MDKKVRDFINETSNAIPIPPGSFLTREKSPSGNNFMTLKIPNGDGDGDLILSTWWENPNKPANKDKSPPKHTGGKQPYVMLMINEVEKLREKGVKNVEEITGYLVSLGKNIEWNTGRLIHKRSKKPLKYTDLQTIFSCGNKKLNRLLAEMKKHELLFSTDSGYCISPRFIKKGKTKKQEGD